jgi:glycosyltransferase involved in cell wall biosynthesis
MPGELLRIAVVAPPFFAVPPDGYGGIETVVALLVDGLVQRGHDVTLIGVGQQATRGGFRATYERPQSDRLGDAMAELTHAVRVDTLLEELRPDIVHDHSAAGVAMSRHRRVPTVITSHGPVTGEWGDYLAAADEAVGLVAISRSQVDLSPQLRWRGVVHNAFDPTAIPVRHDKDDFLLWLGRMSPDKGAHLAIDIARAAGRRLLLAAKCRERSEQAYFSDCIEPRLGTDVQWLGEVVGAEKYALLGAAAALLFPLQWEEPFGMVLLESLAAGTPVVALSRGAVPEIVTDGRTGFVRDRPEELVAALDRLDEIDPAACRMRVVERFAPARMVEGYERVYRRLVRGVRHLPVPVARPLIAAR